MSRRSSYPGEFWRNTSAGKRLRRTWTSRPGSPARYLYERQQGLRQFAGALIALATLLVVLAVFA